MSNLDTSLGTSSDRTTKPEQATEVGSYFVANYPPFSFWSDADLAHVGPALERAPEAETPLGLYLHIPFCRKRCKFCYFRVYTERNARDVDAYVSALTDEIALYARHPGFSQRQLRFVYFGGGTPSFLSARQLVSLVDGLRQSVNWDDAEEVTFECEPGTLNKRKVETLKEIGVSRLSLGVENYNDAILRENGRAHGSSEIDEAYEWIRSVGFPNVNIDLIAGMVGETQENWESCIRKTIELSPESVTIYQMELPYNTVYSREIMSEGQPVPVADWEQKRAWVGWAFAQFERAGYRISSGYTVTREDARVSFSYRDHLWHGADLVGAGVSAFSYVNGVHYQNLDRIEDYIDSVESVRLPLKRALVIGEDEQMIRELILQLKLGRIDLEYFRRKFGRDVLTEFAPTLDELRKSGLVDWQGNELTLSREALLKVDTLLPGFFLPQHRDARYT